MKIKNLIHKKRNRHHLRKINFIWENLPNKKVFKRDGFNLLGLIIGIIIFSYLYYKKDDVEFGINGVIWLMGLGLFIFGSILKLILTNLFPDIIVSEKGIKFMWEEEIAWEEIEKIKVRNDDVLVVYKNLKKRSYGIKELNNFRLAYYIRAFLENIKKQKKN